MTHESLPKRPKNGIPFGLNILELFALTCALGISLSNLNARQLSVKGVPVEVVATASEYVPRSTTVSQPGHSYTDCVGDTSYFGDFNDYGSVGSVSATATTNAHCSTTVTPPAETTLTQYRRVNYTIVKGTRALYLLACTQTWRPSVGASFAGLLAGVASGDSTTAARTSQSVGGKWSKCPAFFIGSNYTLSIRNTSNAELKGTTGGRPSKLDYLSSAALPPAQPSPEPSDRTGPSSTPATSSVHVTSAPSGAEIYVDGKFYGNTPSDITLPTGQHVVRVTIGGKAWTRTVQITAGEISLHAEMPR